MRQLNIRNSAGFGLWFECPVKPDEFVCDLLSHWSRLPANAALLERPELLSLQFDELDVYQPVLRCHRIFFDDIVREVDLRDDPKVFVCFFFFFWSTLTSIRWPSFCILSACG